MEGISGYQWAYLLFDTSRLATILISIILIVYGSFRSIGMESTSDIGEDGESTGCNNSPFGNFLDGFQTITSSQAILIPVGASFSLLIMFFFFDSLQFFFAICTAVLASVAFSFLLLPLFQMLTRSCNCTNKISLGGCGRFTIPELISFMSSSFIVVIWFITGHWILMDALAMGLCVTIIAYIRLPSLKVSTLLLTGLLIYDVFWVFFSSYIFNSNVMVRVATQQATNPLSYIADKLNMHTISNSTPQLSLPGKLVFPSYQDKGRFSMLGLGDIVMPGLLLCFVMRYDNYKRSLLPPDAYAERRITYFHCSLLGYIIGLITATVASEVYKAAQPALLYLVPFTLLPLMIMAYIKGDLRRMWQDPFMSKTLKYMEV